MADNSILPIPNLTLAQHLFTLVTPSLAHLHNNARNSLLDGIKADSTYHPRLSGPLTYIHVDMAPYYRIVTSSGALTEDSALVGSMTAANAEQLIKLD